MKYTVWIRETRDSRWEPNGEGPLTLKTAERILRETRHLVYASRVLAVGMRPAGEAGTEALPGGRFTGHGANLRLATPRELREREGGAA